MKKIVITGATGLIGSTIANKLKESGYHICAFSRDPVRAKKELPAADETAKWDTDDPVIWENHLSEAYGVINLAGANIAAKRWSDEYKKILYDSRIDGTRRISETINKLDNKPKVFLSASAVDYYGNKGEEKITENASPGNNFLSKICKDWEAEAKKCEDNTRLVIGRFATVLDDNEVALAKMVPFFKMCIGGPLGPGDQWFPWVHRDDIAGMIHDAIENDDISGIYNFCSPNPVRMNEFAKALGRALDRPSWFRVPEFLINIVMGEGASMITSSKRVLPHKILEEGYRFKFDNIDQAMKDLFK
ncbi:MAG: TIGR01777 family oxidoreductase [Candidatus Kapaibacterium sp.]